MSATSETLPVNARQAAERRMAPRVEKFPAVTAKFTKQSFGSGEGTGVQDGADLLQGEGTAITQGEGTPPVSQAEGSALTQGEA